MIKYQYQIQNIQIKNAVFNPINIGVRNCLCTGPYEGVVILQSIHYTIICKNILLMKSLLVILMLTLSVNYSFLPPLEEDSCGIYDAMAAAWYMDDRLGFVGELAVLNTVLEIDPRLVDGKKKDETELFDERYGVVSIWLAAWTSSGTP